MFPLSANIAHDKSSARDSAESNVIDPAAARNFCGGTQDVE
jgi:hypothetical protein